MTYDVIERINTIFAANFASDMSALVTAKGLTGQGIDETVVVYPRRRGQQFVTKMAEDNVTAGIGCHARGFVSNAKFSGRRHTTHRVAVEYWALNTSAVALALQLELAGEAVLSCIDRLLASGGSTGIIGVGEEDQEGITGTWGGLSWNEDQTDYFSDFLEVVFTCVSRDEL